MNWCDIINIGCDFMFNFKKKDKLTEQEKNIIKQVSLFFEMYNDIFIKFSCMEEKRKIIKKIYEILHYDDLPQLYSTTKLDLKEGITIYRGISASNNDALKKYVNEFINGDVFYGGRASVYGTGIYTVVGKNLDVASKYASDGGINNCGIVIESKLQKDSKIIKNSEIEEVKSFIFEKMRKMYKKNIEEFMAILEDDGALAAILGYDAIYVEEKNYIVMLNRKKMIINDVDIFNKLDLNNDIKNR